MSSDAGQKKRRPEGKGRKKPERDRFSDSDCCFALRRVEIFISLYLNLTPPDILSDIDRLLDAPRLDLC